MSAQVEIINGQEISLYDIEFLGLMNEIHSRINSFPKGERLKINAWIDCLMVPIKNVQWKKNRNLYAIILIDSLINHKLNEPFNKFPKENKELPWLSVTKVKSELTKKFFKEISIDKTESTGLKLYNNQLNSNKPSINNNKQDDESSTNHNDDDGNSNNNINNVKNNNETNQMHKLDKFKLESIVHELSEESFKRDEIITKQNDELSQLKQRINELEKKVKIVMTHHAQQKQGRVKK